MNDAAVREALEDSVYVAPEAQRRGVGSALLSELIRSAEALGYRRMIAVIGDSGHEASIAIHVKHGFRHAGTLLCFQYATNTPERQLQK